MASIKDLKRMCIMQIGCINCPLNSEDVTCLPDSLPDNADEIIDKWVAEHPVKTYATDFLEKFPNALREIDGSLRACRMNVYGGRKDCPSGGCIDCWNQEMKEDG